MYDPLELTKKVETIVVKGIDKKYFRFRPTRFYGGIATADAVGCNLRCKFCWSGNSVWDADNKGEFYSPRQVAAKLHLIALRKGYTKVRISGGEPTLGREHLIEVLKEIDSRMLFILETNGILLGNDKKYAQELSKFPSLHVRVCLKGIDAKEFSLLTGAESGFDLQMKSLEHLRDINMSFNIAVVSLKKDKKELKDRLIEMDLDEIMIEEEEIKLYPAVRDRLKNTGLLAYFEETKKPM